MTAWLLDLDNTLYPASIGLFARVDARIAQYMATRLAVPAEQVAELRKSYWQTYGLTLGGLMIHHGVDPDDYLAYVHDVPLDEFLGPDPQLAAALASLPGRKVIFTNGSVAHAQAVLDLLGVAALIEGIFDIAFMDYVPKPKLHGYRKILAALGEDPTACWMVDDLADNLETARALGVTTVLVAEQPVEGHLHVRSARELPRLVSGES